MQTRLATAANGVAVRGLWFAIHQQCDDRLASCNSRDATVVCVWGPALFNHTLLERLGPLLVPPHSSSGLGKGPLVPLNSGGCEC
jgi:hypothetical protein